MSSYVSTQSKTKVAFFVLEIKVLATHTCSSKVLERTPVGLLRETPACELDVAT